MKCERASQFLLLAAVVLSKAIKLCMECVGIG